MDANVLWHGGRRGRRYCPAQGMLAKIMPMKMDCLIYEGDSKEVRELVTRGEWTPA